ncbi:putative ribonuclease H-like domain-containing protein [Tanacetum coccineum]
MFKLGASHTLEATHVEFFSDEDEPEVNLGNILTSYTVPTTPNTRIHKDHPIKNVIGDVKSFVQTRRMKKPTFEQGFLSAVYEEKSHDTLNTCLYACFLSQIEPTSTAKALSDSSWVEAMQEELLQFKLQQSAFLYGTIKEEIYVTQPPGFKDPDHPDKVYKVIKALYGLHQAPRAWYETLANYMLGNGFQRGKIDQTLFIKRHKGETLLIQMSSIGELTFFLGLQVTQKEDGIFISHDKYVDEILKKFNYTDVKHASTLIDLERTLVKDGDDNDVDVHLYRSMVGSLMYLTTSRPDIIYLKGKPTLGLWYSRDSSFELVAYTDSDYAGATQDRKSTTRDFLQKVSDEAVHKESSDRMEMDATTASSLEAEQKSEEEEPTELVEDFGSGEKGEKEVIIAEAALNTASASISTVSPLRVSTGEDISGVETLVYIRRSASKDKGKAIMQESEPPKKIKKRVQVQISVDEELAKKVFEEEQVIFNAEQESDPAVLRYHAVQNRSFSKAEVRKNMCIYLKNQGGYKMSHFKGMSYENIRPIFERVWDYNQSFVPMESDSLVPKKAAGSSKRNAEEELIQDSSKKQKIGESSVPVEESDDKEPVKLSQEELQKLMIIVPEEGMHVEALLDLIKLWSLVQERFNSPGLTEDKEKELWAEMKMLFEPDEKDLLELQKYMHDPLKWRLYDTCVVHHVSIERGQDIFMLVEKDYPLTRGLLMWMFG